MKKLLLAACIALAACTPQERLPTGTSPGPTEPVQPDRQKPQSLINTTVDDKALTLAWRTFDLYLTSIDALIAAGKLKPGEPRAIAIADTIARTRAALQVADAASKASNEATLSDAIERAMVGVNGLTALMQGI